MVSVLAVLFPLAACSGGGGGGAAEPGVVQVKDNSFSPKTIDVHTGDTVTWKWVGSVDHNVVGPGFTSPTQGKGTTFTHTFDKAGDVDYVCTIHTGMTGKVRVTAK
jgi:plastocyanin